MLLLMVSGIEMERMENVSNLVLFVWQLGQSIWDLICP